MKVVLLAGGVGSRLSEESALRPKPMIEIGGKPILWHIMKTYAHHGLTEFIICCGYKGYMIKEYFAHYFMHNSDMTFDLTTNTSTIHQTASEKWRVTLVDTGEHTMTGGRLKRVASYLNQQEDFCFTYGDGVGDIDIQKLIAFHQKHGKLATLTATQPPGRFGMLGLDKERVTHFMEKPHGDGGWINGGFFVLKPQVLEYITGDETSWEREPLEQLASKQQLMAYTHHGFWQPMDTLRDKNHLEDLWRSGKAPWNVWAPSTR